MYSPCCLPPSRGAAILGSHSTCLWLPKTSLVTSGARPCPSQDPSPSRLLRIRAGSTQAIEIGWWRAAHSTWSLVVTSPWVTPTVFWPMLPSCLMVSFAQQPGAALQTSSSVVFSLAKHPRVVRVLGGPALVLLTPCGSSAVPSACQGHTLLWLQRGHCGQAVSRYWKG